MYKLVICHIGTRFRKQFLDILSNCFLEQLVLEPTRGEVMALSNTQRVISRTITEALNNSAQNTITFRSLWEGLCNNVTLNFRKEKVLSIRKWKSLQKTLPKAEPIWP